MSQETLPTTFGIRNSVPGRADFRSIWYCSAATARAAHRASHGRHSRTFPPFELARHHFAHPVPTQEGFFQTAMILQTPLRKLRRRDLGKIQAERRAQRGFDAWRDGSG